MDIKRGDIFYIYPGYAVGSEQRSGRPGIIVSNEANNQFSPTVEVVYTTTQPKSDLPTHVTIRSTPKESTAICEQITTVALERLGDYAGHVTEGEMMNLEIAMAISLGLDFQSAAQVRKTEASAPAEKPAPVYPPERRSFGLSLPQ